MKRQQRSSAVQRLLRTRRCRACGERYHRSLPNCPVCKTKVGHDGLSRSPDHPWSVGGLGF